MTTNSIPHTTIKAMARSLFKETVQYGFQQVDYLRFVNILLDMSMKNGYQAEEIGNRNTLYHPINKINLPLIGERIKIREFVKKKDKSNLEKWLIDKGDQNFLICRITAETSDIDQLINSERNILGVITLNDSSEMPIGLLAFIDYDKIQGKAELRELIGVPEFRGRGLAKEATKLWIQFGISTLGLKKIYLNALDTNTRNIKLNEELDF